MLITKTGPAGIDAVIQSIQTDLHAYLLSKWTDIDISAYECNGRCYRNKKDEGYIAEVYVSANEYKEVFWNDNLAAISFFGVSSQETHDKGEKVNVHLVFFVNLQKLKPLIAHRADEEVRKDVQNYFLTLYPGVYKSTELWLENVLSEYAGSYRDDRLKAVDMHPVHCFRLNLEITYNKNICP
jgi:hypothetical protein